MSQNSGALSRDSLLAFPKVELHRHLEGTFSLPTLHRMALRNGLPFPEDADEFRKLVQFPKDSDPDFLKFLSLFKNDWYRSLDDVAEITAASVGEFAADGLFYIELRFSPEHFAYHNGFDRAEVTRTVIAAADEAALAHDVEIRYLITLNRSKQEESAMIELYELIRDLGLQKIVGIDLAGDETNFPPELFERLFSIVADEGVLKSTIHAGEVTPAEQIWDAINLLHASRIGHGVAAIHDTDLQKLLSEREIVLEQCITSNFQTGSWTDESSHPMGELHRRGVPVTINSDDPFIQDTDLTEDYAKAVRHFDFTVDDLAAINLRALNAAFIGDDEKRQLQERYLEKVAEFRASYEV
jgi:adenosine deaminase